MKSGADGAVCILLWLRETARGSALYAPTQTVILEACARLKRVVGDMVFDNSRGVYEYALKTRPKPVPNVASTTTMRSGDGGGSGGDGGGGVCAALSCLTRVLKLHAVQLFVAVPHGTFAVSYTHLTLPTIYSV